VLIFLPEWLRDAFQKPVGLKLAFVGTIKNKIRGGAYCLCLVLYLEPCAIPSSSSGDCSHGGSQDDSSNFLLLRHVWSSNTFLQPLEVRIPLNAQQDDVFYASFLHHQQIENHGPLQIMSQRLSRDNFLRLWPRAGMFAELTALDISCNRLFPCKP